MLFFTVNPIAFPCIQNFYSGIISQQKWHWQPFYLPPVSQLPNPSLVLPWAPPPWPWPNLSAIGQGTADTLPLLGGVSHHYSAPPASQYCQNNPFPSARSQRSLIPPKGHALWHWLLALPNFLTVPCLQRVEKWWHWVISWRSRKKSWLWTQYLVSSSSFATV